MIALANAAFAQASGHIFGPACEFFVREPLHRTVERRRDERKLVRLLVCMCPDGIDHGVPSDVLRQRDNSVEPVVLDVHHEARPKYGLRLLLNAATASR